MKRKPFTQEQIIGILKEAEAGAVVTELCRKQGMSSATYYRPEGQIRRAGGTLETDNPTLIAAYEKRLTEAEARKADLAEAVATCGRPLASFDDAFGTSMSFFANPCEIWFSGRLDPKQMVLNLVFADRLGYERESGFRTLLLSSLFTVFQPCTGEVGVMAHPTGYNRLSPTLAAELKAAVDP